MIDAVMTVVLALSVGGLVAWLVAWLVVFMDDSIEQVPPDNA